MERPRWTKKEIELLKAYYSSADRGTLHHLFPDRSWRSIIHKGTRFRIPRESIRGYLRPSTLQLSHDDALYLAGLLDGEGMFTVGVRRSEKVVKGETYGRVALTPLISITNTHLPLIEWCHSVLGGSTLKSPYDAGGKRKIVLTLQLSRLLDLKALLEQILPYLKVKQRQAELLLEFCNIRLSDKWSAHNPKLFDITNELRTLNKKGKGTAPVMPPAAAASG